MTSASQTREWAWSVDGYGNIESLVLRERPASNVGDNQILVEVEAAALNPLDLKLVSGNLRQFMPVDFPFVPGSDACGEVIAVGASVKKYRPGERVVGLTAQHGAMASHVLFNEGPMLTRVVDETLASSDLAAIPETGLTAKAIMRAAQLNVGQRVAIIGATGGIGLFLCQLAARAGAVVVATAQPGEEDLVQRNGASATVHYSGDRLIPNLRAVAPEGFDVVVDLVHQFEPLLQIATMARSGGRLISTLMGPDPSQYPPGVTAHYIRLSPQPGDLESLLEMVSKGELRVNVSRTFDFERVPQAYRELRDGHVVGKLVVKRSAS